MFQKLQGLVVGASHKFEGGIDSIILIVGDDKLSVGYVFRHIFCSVIKYYRKASLNIIANITTSALPTVYLKSIDMFHTSMDGKIKRIDFI